MSAGLATSVVPTAPGPAAVPATVNWLPAGRAFPAASLAPPSASNAASLAWIDDIGGFDRAHLPLRRHLSASVVGRAGVFGDPACRRLSPSTPSPNSVVGRGDAFGASALAHTRFVRRPRTSVVGRVGDFGGFNRARPPFLRLL